MVGYFISEAHIRCAAQPDHDQPAPHPPPDGALPWSACDFLPRRGLSSAGHHSGCRDKLGLPKGQRLGLWEGDSDRPAGAGEADEWSEDDDSWGAGENDEEAKALAAVGLPTSFAGGAAAQRSTGHRKRRSGRQAEGAGGAAAGSAWTGADCEQPVRQTLSAVLPEWQQAWDEQYGVYYYYNESLQVTQPERRIRPPAIKPKPVTPKP